jgi:hypothetical protein
LKATTVPEVFLFDGEEQLLYRGRIDDTYAGIGKKRPQARTHDLRDRLDALVAHKPIAFAHLPAVGCPITFSPTIRSSP